MSKPTSAGDALRDLFRAHAVASREPLAQGPEALRLAVVERHRSVSLDRRSRAVCEIADREGLRRRNAARQRDHPRVRQDAGPGPTRDDIDHEGPVERARRSMSSSRNV